MNSRDIVRAHAWRGPYRRPSSERIRNWIFAAAFGLWLGYLAGSGF